MREREFEKTEVQMSKTKFVCQANMSENLNCTKYVSEFKLYLKSTFQMCYCSAVVLLFYSRGKIQIQTPFANKQ